MWIDRFWIANFRQPEWINCIAEIWHRPLCTSLPYIFLPKSGTVNRPGFWRISKHFSGFKGKRRQKRLKQLALKNKNKNKRKRWGTASGIKKGAMPLWWSETRTRIVLWFICCLDRLVIFKIRGSVSISNYNFALTNLHEICLLQI